MRMYDIILKKRANLPLTDKEIDSAMKQWELILRKELKGRKFAPGDVIHLTLALHYTI